VKKRYVLAALLILLTAALAYTVLQRASHEFTAEQCTECHAAVPVKGKRETLVMTAPISALCGRCHGALGASASHPVEIVPAEVAVPADLPLSREGKMTCSTCHDIHGAVSGSSGASRAYLRRTALGPAFCSSCHGQGLGHAQMMGRAHMQQAPESAGITVDAVSRGCLSCHDGSIGPNETVNAGTWEHGRPLSRFDPRGIHPIGVDYQNSWARKRGGLRPIAAVNPVIKLIDGKVGCSSCHDPYSKQSKKLVMANTGSRLCLGCHDK
jgi:predicted CXXCH cytochrome family protein